jgi:hypothetical protein
VRESLAEAADLPDTPLAHLGSDKIRPSAESLQKMMGELM